MAKSPMLTPQEATRELLDVSVTERVGFRTCRRRWKLETIDNLAPRLPIWALEFGTGMHAALEAFYKTRSMKKGHAALDTWYKKEEKRSAENELQGLEGADELLQELFELQQLGHVMLDNYKLFDATAKVQLGKILAVEGRFKKGVKFTNKPPEGYPAEAKVLLHPSGRLLVPLVDPSSKRLLTYHGDGTYAGGHIYLTARIDLLTERKTPKKGIWVVDHKTAAQAHQEDGLEFDDQVTGYCYTVWRWTGVIPRGVVYNDLIKTAPKDPRMVKEGTELSAAKDQLTTAEQYKVKLKELGLMTPGGLIVQEKYEDCLNSLLARGWDPFFRRFEPTRNEAQLLAFEENLLAEYWDMTGTKEDPKLIYPNKMVMNCRGCPVKRVCLAMDDGSDPQSVIDTEYIIGRDRKAA